MAPLDHGAPADARSATATRTIAVDGNEAVAMVAHRLNEIAVLYPITPSSPMGELADDWSAHGRENLWGRIPEIVEMQSEAGAAGACHGALQAGALVTTFTASQGLLLMIPNMYKIAGELTPFVMHVAARTVATHALSIFGDHSDVMACRQTGFAMLASGSVQEAHDFAAIAQAASLRARVPFLHFFDGFRTSHEIARLDPLDDETLRALVDHEAVAAHRSRALTPDRPVVRGTAQNPDTFFQAREAANPFHDAGPGHVRAAMDALAEATGRRYGLVDYVGDPEAERVVVMMGSGAETAHETVERLTAAGEKVGVLKVRLYRPFPAEDLIAALPATTRRIAVLDRTKEPGAVGEPLFLDVTAVLAEHMATAEAPRFAAMPRVVGGRYGLSGKEFDPPMVKAVFDALAAERPPARFTVGITDDVTGLSLPVDRDFGGEADDVYRAVFYGLGSDGTVGANKNSIKIIAAETARTGGRAQGYFVYDSRKAGAVTVSHLRFAPRPIRSAYLIGEAQFVACHQMALLERYDVLAHAAPGATLLLNAPHAADAVWDTLPAEVQEAILAKDLDVWTIDAAAVAKEAGLGRRINTIMQTCFFELSRIVAPEVAIGRIREAIEKTYGRKSPEIVRRNLAAVDRALDHLYRVTVPNAPSATRRRPPPVPETAPDFVQRVTAAMLAGHGDGLPVSAFPPDGTWPTGTARFEKRNIAAEIPVWDPAVCIQCNKCAMVCPHAAVRVKVADPAALADAPATFKHVPYRGKEFGEAAYMVQVAPEDCTGCTLCVAVCPAKDKADPKHKALEMAPHADLVAPERENFAFFLDLPEADRAAVPQTAKHVQLLEPLFEFSGACSGCGETPYIKLMTQLFGDRAIVANATGCSSIYGGNLPTTPYRADRHGRGPAWSNSLFEDNAEFGLGMRLAVDKAMERAQALVLALADRLDDALVAGLLTVDQHDEAGIAAQRERVAALRAALGALDDPRARALDVVADYLVRKSVWIVGGDGWAYDIGFGGVDHVLGLGRDVNLLVLDTEVYSNTGGQQSKATPLGAAAKFAMAGRAIPKKDLGMAAMAYEHVYVARVAFGAKDAQTVKAFQEAESYRGPSLIIAYSPCIAHGYDLAHGLDQQKAAVDSGHWPLFRFDPRRLAAGQKPLQLDCGPPKIPLADYTRNEARYRMVERQDPERWKMLLKAAEEDVRLRWDLYTYMAGFAEAPADDTTAPAAD